MKTRRSKFLLALSVPILILIGLLFKPATAYLFGDSIAVKTVPVDPRDLLYGDYVYLELDINQVSADKLSKELKEKIKSEQEQHDVFTNARSITVYSSLEKAGEMYEVDAVSLHKPEDGIYLKGEIMTWYSPESASTFYIDYGLNRFYIEENTGKALEEKSTRGELELILKVKNGYALIEDIVMADE